MEESNNSFYKRSYKKYGVTAKGVHWKSTYTQYRRFEILTHFIKNQIHLSSIVDAGCGFAEYYNYLNSNNLKVAEYIGIDCEKIMTDISSKRFPYIFFETKDILNDELPNADYYICSGAMNTFKEKDIFTFISKCFLASKKGFIFNFLKDDRLCTVDYIKVINFCKNLSKNIEFRDDYLPNDFSIFIKK